MAIASFLTVMVLSLLVARVATVALTLTGVSHEVARFQARSALTGTGYTTEETENIVRHPVRRRIVMHLMLLRNAGVITATASFFLSFATSGDTSEGLRRAIIITAGLGVLWLLSLSELLERALNRFIRWALNRWTEIDARDYARLLDLSGDYAIREMAINQSDWLIGKTLSESRLQDEGILVLGIRRADGRYIGAPVTETVFKPGDLLILYGDQDSFRALDHRQKGSGGDRAHEDAVRRQREIEADQQKQEARAEAK